MIILNLPQRNLKRNVILFFGLLLCGVVASAASMFINELQRRYVIMPKVLEIRPIASMIPIYWQAEIDMIWRNMIMKLVVIYLTASAAYWLKTRTIFIVLLVTCLLLLEFFMFINGY